MMSRRLVLASSSPRRVDLLRQLGLDFEVRATQINEKRKVGEKVKSYVRRMAKEKAESALLPNHITLGADTVVSLGRRIFGKPENAEDALTMLMALSGRWHKVVTGVALNDGNHTESLVVTTKVSFRDITAGEARQYWATGEPKDKCGGYAIQGRGAVFVDRLIGSYSAVVGLPLSETQIMLEKFGIKLW